MATQKKQDIVVSDNAAYILRSGTSVYLKTADICAITGKSNQWVGQLVSQGILNKRSTPYGAMFDLTATMRAYCDMLEERTRPAESEEQISAEKERLSYELSMKKAKATITTLEAMELQSKMHRSEDVANMTEDLIYAIRGMLLALPGRLAIDAANLTNPAEVSDLIRHEVYQVMEELSRYEYDPQKYEERVRERMSWEKIEHGASSNDDG